MVHPHFVDFVEQKEWIAHARLGHFLQQLAGHGADVRSAMAANLSLIPDATQGHANEFAIGRAGN